MRFTKMQGIGNDYIYVNCFEETVRNPGMLARRMSRRHYGVGADGLVLIEPSDVADFGMRIFNSDGSESEMCGNASRCIGKYVYERGLTDKTSLTLMTGSGLKTLNLNVADGRVRSVRVDMGTPELNPRMIPVDLPGEIILGHRLELGNLVYALHCVSMGNPHCVLFVRNPDNADVEHIGPLLENYPIFPNRTNVEFVQVEDRTHIRLRVWERGAGETLACGTGACAALVVSVLTGRADRNATVELPGGELEVSWSAEDNHVYQEGPAEFVYDGEWAE
ncbi:MAG: diaminopimelate epimerase [Christensenellaceae bacterium]|nr:diaminopimelate epimerase [Christensenellaceae bacterium]